MYSKASKELDRFDSTRLIPFVFNLAMLKKTTLKPNINIAKHINKTMIRCVLPHTIPTFNYLFKLT